MSLREGSAGHIGGIFCYTVNMEAYVQVPNSEVRCVQIVSLDVCAKQADKLGRHGSLPQVYTAKSSITDKRTF